MSFPDLIGESIYLIYWILRLDRRMTNKVSESGRALALSVNYFMV
jgi:hypothetical protein